MCGIAGIYDFEGREPDRRLLAAMADAIRHRGPDDEGFYTAPGIGLAHRRLSILDLSPAGHQPMADPAGRYWLIFNGEIYNYLELRAELQTLGYVFRSGSDTEVLLAAYEQWGTDCLKRFNGMWAFALWDTVHQRLFCARDRLGVKPLYYAQTSGQLIFGSEIKALLAVPGLERRVNPDVSQRFLQYALLDVDEQTFFEGVSQLPAAHYLLLDPQGLKLKRYWDVPDEPARSYSGSKASLRFKALFSDSVRLRLRSDVPIGTCLSGGLDSSAIVCTAARLIQEAPSQYHQQTFSSCFDDARFDERPFIDDVIAWTGAQSNRVFPNPGRLLEELPALVVSQDEPFGSLSVFAQRCVMASAREAGVTVMLDGQGADELLAGYLFDSAYWNELRQQRNYATLFSELGASLAGQGLRATGRRAVKSLLPDGLEPWVQRSEGRGLLTREISPWQDHKRFSGKLKNTLYNHLTMRLQQLLRYEDRNSMAYGIEARLPFLDYRLVEFAFALPGSELIHRTWSKWVMRQALAGILPETIRWRKDKMGFVTPQSVWLRRELAPFLRELFASTDFQQRPYWDGPAVARRYEGVLSGREDPAFLGLAWRLASFELWLQQVVAR